MRYLILALVLVPTIASAEFRNDWFDKCKCQKHYSGFCFTEATFVAALKNDCEDKKPEGIDCERVGRKGIFGKECNKFYRYIDKEKKR